MATAPMKSQPLHNFSLPLLKWSKHHQNRTRNPSTTDTSEPDNNNDDDESSRHHRIVGSRSSRIQRLSFTTSDIKPQNDAAERVLKQKSVSETDLTEKALKEPVVLEKNETEEEEEEGEVVGKPWNLRPRKVQKALFNEEVLENHHHHNSVNTKAPKSTRLREMAESRGNNGEKKEKNKFWLTLSREEVEEDIFIMTGSRPARRPKKRPKNVQKQLDNVFPGLWLMGLTVDSYRIADAPIKK